MKCFTIEISEIKEYLKVPHLIMENFEIDAVEIGEKGRNRKLRYIPVKKLNGNNYSQVQYISLGTTKSGKPKLFETIDKTPQNVCIIAVLMKYGFRGGAHMEERPGINILAEGRIADGMAGRMAECSQYLLTLEKGVDLVIKRSGRLYGAEPVYIYRFDGEKLIRTTPELEELRD